MMVLLVVGIVILALVLVGLIRVGVQVEYAQNCLEVRLLAGPAKITLFPRKARKPKPRKKPKRTKAKQAKPKKAPPTAEEVFALVKQLLPVAIEAAGQLRRKIRIDAFYLDITVASADPAKAAVNYGRLNGAIGMLWPLVEQNFKVKEWRIRTWVDFTTEHPTLSLRAAATLTIGQILSLGIRVASRLLPILLKQKDGNKSRQETQKEAV